MTLFLFSNTGNFVSELTQPNNGKASILCEATRLLKDLFVQIESLKKENVNLLSESNYVSLDLKQVPFFVSKCLKDLYNFFGTRLHMELCIKGFFYLNR